MLEDFIYSRRPGGRLMQNHLFAMPQAIVAEVNPPAWELDKHWAVWLLQGVVVLLIIGLSLATLAGVSVAFWHESHPDWPFALASCAIGGVLFLGVVLVLVGSERRHPSGRRLGLILIAFLILLATGWAVNDLWFVLFFRSAIPRPGLVAVEELALHFAVVVGLGWWFRMFGYSPRALAWFGMPTHRVSVTR
jgi:hypothetical protein